MSTTFCSYIGLTNRRTQIISIINPRALSSMHCSEAESAAETGLNVFVSRSHMNAALAAVERQFLCHFEHSIAKTSPIKLPVEIRDFSPLCL